MMDERKENNHVVLASILSSRFTYALNWYTVSPALLLIVAAYGVKNSYSGLIMSSFLLAVGVFQIPSGILSSRYGSKPVAMNGLLLLSVFTIATPLATSFPILLMFRFIAGMGAAMFFAPAIGILSSFVSAGNRTGVIGYYNAAFQLGAGFAILLWPLLMDYTGWRAGVIIGGVLCLATYAVSMLTVKMDRAAENASTGVTLHEIASVLRNRQIWVISIGFIGIWGAFNAASSYLYVYSVTYLRVNSGLASILSSLILFVGLIGGAMSGPLHRKIKNGRTLLIMVSCMFSASLLLFLFDSIVAAAIGSVLLGVLFTSGVSITYALPAHMRSVGLKNIPLAVSLVNGIQVMCGFWVPFAFGAIAFDYGFHEAWIAMFLISIGFVPLYFALPKTMA